MNQPTLFGQLSAIPDGVQPAPPADPVQVMRDNLFDAARDPDGCQCPVCDRNVKVYKRKLNANMAHFLVQLAVGKSQGRQSMHHSELNYKGRDYSYLKQWGFAKTTAADTDKKTHSGEWQITETGMAFAMGRVRAWTHAIILDNQLLKYSGESTTIQQALGNEFNYAELMAEIITPEDIGQ